MEDPNGSSFVGECMWGGGGGGEGGGGDSSLFLAGLMQA